MSLVPAAPVARLLPPARSALALLLASLLAASGLARAGTDPDLPGPPANPELIKAGALVIPMDTTSQLDAGLFNLKAYGLVMKLMWKGIPVKWAIKAGKAKDAPDFTANVARIAPSALPAANVTFSSGPFIVPADYATLAQDAVTDFANNVAVYQTTADNTIDIRYTLTTRPYVSVSNINTTIHVDVLKAAGIPGQEGTSAGGKDQNPSACPGGPSETCNWHVEDPAQLTAGTCNTVHTEPHRGKDDDTNPANRTGVAAFLGGGGNFLAQCQAVAAFEKLQATPAVVGTFLTTLGVQIQNTDQVLTYPNPDLAFSQFSGALAGDVGGSERDFSVDPGAFKNDGHIHALDPAAVNGVQAWQAGAGKVKSGIGGNVFYLGGHQYDATDAAGLNGYRMLLNAIFVPAIRPSSCNLDLAPNLTLAKEAPATVAAGASFDYTLKLGNSGGGVTGLTIKVRDQLPAGIKATAVTAGANVSAIDCGTLPSAEGAELTCTLTLASNMAAGAANGTSVFTITATAPATAGSTTNYAAVDPAGPGTPPTPGESCTPVTSCGSAPTTITAPNVTLAKQGPPTAPAGGAMTYTIQLGNSGNVASPPTINVADQLPAGVAATAATIGTNVSGVTCAPLNSAGAALSCTVTLASALAAGAPNGTATFTITATAPGVAGGITNYAAASPAGNGTPPTPGPGCTPATSCGSAPTTITAPNVTLAKQGPATAVVGSAMTYTIQLGNSGNAATPTTINVADQLPAGVAATAATKGTNVSSVSCSPLNTANAALSCTVTLTAAMAASSPNGTSTFTITATAPGATGSITNYAAASPSGGGTPPTPGAGCTPAASCGSAPTTIIAPNVTLAKLGPASVLPGATMTYTIRLGNSGTAASPTTINVADQLPAGVVATAATKGTNVDGVSCAPLGSAGATLSCTVTLTTAMAASAPNGTSTFTITATAPSAAGNITNYASASPDGSGTPPTPGAGCTPAASCGSAPTLVVAPPTEVPTLSWQLLAVLTVLLAVAGAQLRRPRRG